MSGFFDIEKNIKRLDEATVSVYIPALATGSDEETPIFVAPRDCQILAVGIIVADAITGVADNNFEGQFINKGSAGTGTDSIALKEYANGVDLAAFVFDDYGTITNGTLSEGDTVTFAKVENGTGMDQPALVAIVQYRHIR